MTDDQHKLRPTMSAPNMQPLSGEQGSLIAAPKPVPGWMAVVSIMFGIVGLLCWGQQGVSTLLTDMSEMEAAGLTLSDGHHSLALVGYLVNIALAILLLVGGFKASAGNQFGAAKILRGWALLKFASIAAGLVIAYVYFDDLVAMNRTGLAQALAESATATNELAPTESAAGAPDEAFSKGLIERLSVAIVLIQAAVLAAWPCIVLAVVPRKSTLATMETASQSGTLE